MFRRHGCEPPGTTRRSDPLSALLGTTTPKARQAGFFPEDDLRPHWRLARCSATVRICSGESFPSNGGILDPGFFDFGFLM